MKNDISLILNEFHRRRQFFTLQAELETRQTDILALDYEIDHASGPFQSKKKKSLMQKTRGSAGAADLPERGNLTFCPPVVTIPGGSVRSPNA